MKDPFKSRFMKKQSQAITIVILLFLFAGLQSSSQVTDYAVMVEATIQESPPSLIFSWPTDPSASGYTIFRKSPGDTSWGAPRATLNGNAVIYIDTDITVETNYEYGFYKTLNRFSDTIIIANGTLATFTIFDTWGDGMCCQHGLGSYAVRGLDQLYASGGAFGAQESTTFYIQGPSGSTHDTVIIDMILDVYGGETSWELVDEGGGPTIIAEDGYDFHKYGHTLSGIRVPFTEQRGTVLLLVDNTMITPLYAEIKQLESDLIGDGWKIARINVDRHTEVPVVKQMIVNAVNNDNSINTLFILGHVPVPYSGNIMSAHTDHCGAYPTDIYYAEFDDNWTDLYVNNTTATRPANHNVPGDGKFDNTFLESGVDLMVGRVDLYDLPAFCESETELLARYLEKNHNFRYGIFNPQRRGLIDDNVGVLAGLAPCATGWRYFSCMFGPENVHAADYFSTMGNESYLWSQGAGGGSYVSCGGIGTTSDFASNTVYSVFTMLYGSYFGDWDNTNNILRAPLASQGGILTCCWAGAPVWDFQHMALGKTIGESTLLTQNNINLYAPADRAYQVPTSLMGDPTLRLHTVLPVSGVETIQENQQVLLTWLPSSDQVIGYHVFRATTLHSDFIRLTSDAIQDLSFIDTEPLAGNNVYMVRALKLELSSSGSYYNLSHGVVDSLDFVVGMDQFGPSAEQTLQINPNPFKAQCRIHISVPYPTRVSMKIYSNNGMLVKTLFTNQKLSKGTHVVTWNGKDNQDQKMEPGIYYITLETLSNKISSKVILTH
jgi:hypothetical protein